MRRILATGTPSHLRSTAKPSPVRTVSRTYKRTDSDPLRIVRAGRVAYAPNYADKDSRVVADGGMTGTMLQRRAIEAERLWREQLKAGGR